jgi:hypothetical protein
MTHLFDRFSVLFPEFKEINEQNIIDDSKKIVGWNSVVLTKDNEAIAAGTHQSKETSRRIAIAECLERIIVKKLIKNNINGFCFEDIPSSSGCAVGFENHTARGRAIYEGIERWIWSQWIDDGKKINQIELDLTKLSPLAKFYFNKFDKVIFFRKTFDFDSKFLVGEKLQFGAVLGIKDDGIYPGSRVASVNEDIWTHGFIEAWRNYVIANLNQSGHKDSIILDRINFFSKNKEFALDQIEKSKNENWQSPRIRIIKPYVLEEFDPFYFWRSLCHDFIPWDKGDSKRFVY